MKLLDELNARLRFGMQPGLEGMQRACDASGNPERRLRGVIHVAGTNGKGAVCSMLDACLRCGGFRVGRYTSPHLVSVNERFFLDGVPVSDMRLDAAIPPAGDSRGLTYFEFLTLVAFGLYAAEDPDFVVLETGLGGRLDATNVCAPVQSVITRIGLDHCEWLGDTVERIAEEKAGIVKAGVPVVLGANVPAVRAVVEARAKAVGAPFFYAPEIADASELPSGLSLAGIFNRENAVTALAALKVLCLRPHADRLELSACMPGFAQTAWPGRFQRIGRFIIDGAHNPPAAEALAAALSAEGLGEKSLNLVCGFCADKDVMTVLNTLAPFVARAFAVRTGNPRSLEASDLAARLVACGMRAEACASLQEALAQAEGDGGRLTLVCGSLFLAGEALLALGASPWEGVSRRDVSERLSGERTGRMARA